MSYFIRNGNTFRVADSASLDIHDKLPAGNYIIQKDPFGNLILEQIDSFTNPTKIYGDCLKNSERIMNTFKNRSASTGVMLNGEKGSGKTLLAKTLSIMGAEQGIPTLVINNPWCGDQFNTLLQDIDQPCIVLFDEFEKVYGSDEQESILTLLDGVFPSKKLFIITCNDKWRVDQHMRNRPGRIFYMIDFKGLEHDFIVEYCNDNLNAKEHIGTICKIATLFNEFNFDMLKALVEEMNRYNETPQEALKILNAKPEYATGSLYDVQVINDNQLVRDDHIDPPQWKGNPLSDGIFIDYRNDENTDDPWQTIELTQRDLQRIDPKDGRFIFNHKRGIVTLTRVREKFNNYYAAF